MQKYIFNLRLVEIMFRYSLKYFPSVKLNFLINFKSNCTNEAECRIMKAVVDRMVNETSVSVNATYHTENES